MHAGEDLTGAEARLTQAEMDRVLGCQLLTRVVFHSQADIAGLLEVSKPGTLLKQILPSALSLMHLSLRSDVSTNTATWAMSMLLAPAG